MPARHALLARYTSSDDGSDTPVTPPGARLASTPNSGTGSRHAASPRARGRVSSAGVSSQSFERTHAHRSGRRHASSSGVVPQMSRPGRTSSDAANSITGPSIVSPGASSLTNNASPRSFSVAGPHPGQFHDPISRITNGSTGFLEETEAPPGFESTSPRSSVSSPTGRVTSNRAPSARHPRLAFRTASAPLSLDSPYQKARPPPRPGPIYMSNQKMAERDLAATMLNDADRLAAWAREKGMVLAAARKHWEKIKCGEDPAATVDAWQDQIGVDWEDRADIKQSGSSSSKQQRSSNKAGSSSNKSVGGSKNTKSYTSAQIGT